MKAPICPQYPYVHLKHGHRRIDPFQWLNKRDNPQVLDYLKAENEYTQQSLKRSEEFQEALFEEMKARFVKDDSSVPYFLNAYWYQTRYEEGKEYPIYSRWKNNAEEAQDFLDVNELAEGKSFYNIGGKSISPSNEWLCYGEDTLSRRIYNLRFKNLNDGKTLENEIPGTTGSAIWASDSEHLFYARKDAQTLRSFQIWRHKLGTSSDEDQLVFEEKDPEFDCFVYKTKCKTYLVIGSASSTCNEYRYLKADNPTGEFRLFLPRKAKHEYSFTHFNGHFYLLSNHENQNFALYRVSQANVPAEDWECILAGREDVLLESIEIFEKHLVIIERKGGLTHLRVTSWDKTQDYYVPFNDPTYSVDLEINTEFEAEELRFSYTSLTTPNSTLSIKLESGDQRILKEQKVLGSFKKEDYQSERLWAKGKDGTQIPISLVYKKGFKEQTYKPILLYGYGSYGISMDPYFSSVRLSLLDRGFAFAIAHIRGGEELGRPWYENAKWLKKKNTFEDFISCAEFLIQEKVCSAEALFAMGGSAGGLLMGAVMNMRPDLWAGLVASVPFVDVVTTMLDDSIPLTTGEYEEWGNPNDKTYYDYMLSYSPYDNIMPNNFPPLLVTSGYHDSQVQYWEPTKWVAKLRLNQTGNAPILLHTNLEAGHSGKSGRFAPLKEVAMEYAFLMNLANINE
ncbi:MAG: S9 family peptidase [Luteibaculum sp.]